MSAKREVVEEARELLNTPMTSVRFRDAAEPLLQRLADEAEADLAVSYTPERVQRIIRRIAKAAMLPALGDEIINAIEKPPRRKRSSHAR